jgi:hypothetical protein
MKDTTDGMALAEGTMSSRGLVDRVREINDELSGQGAVAPPETICGKFK